MSTVWKSKKCKLINYSIYLKKIGFTLHSPCKTSLYTITSYSVYCNLQRCSYICITAGLTVYTIISAQWVVHMYYWRLLSVEILPNKIMMYIYTIMLIHTYSNWLCIKNTQQVHLVFKLITLRNRWKKTRLVIPYAFY